MLLSLIKHQSVPKKLLQRSFSQTGKVKNEYALLLYWRRSLAFHRERVVSYPRFAIHPEIHGQWVTAKDLQRYQILEKGEKAENDLVTLTGRIVSKRESSGKLVFYDIVQNGESLQVVASQKRFGGSKEEFAEKNRDLCRGDIVCKVISILQVLCSMLIFYV